MAHFLYRRPISPESPQPYVSFKPKTSSLFPTNVDETPPLRIDDLPGYISEFNKTHQTKLHIWSRNSHQGLSNSHFSTPSNSNPTIVRFQIPDVLTTFITLGYTKPDPALTVQIVTAFGPREKVSGSFPTNIPRLIALFCRNLHILNLIILHTKTSHNKLQK